MRLRRPPSRPRPLLDPADLTQIWATVLVGEPLRYRVLWLLFLDGDLRPTGPLISLDDLPDGPYDVRAEDLVSLCREFLDGPGSAASVAFLLTRPGAAPWTVSDRAWLRFLDAAADAVAGAETSDPIERGAAVCEPVAGPVRGPVRWPVHWAHQHDLAPGVRA